ncbi:hypothetical protein J6590_095842, partial [Homalodisca vitripennis]
MKREVLLFKVTHGPFSWLIFRYHIHNISKTFVSLVGQLSQGSVLAPTLCPWYDNEIPLTPRMDLALNTNQCGLRIF